MKYKLTILIIIACIQEFGAIAQSNIGLGTLVPHSSALLEINSNNKGLLIPRVSLTNETDIVTIANPAASLVIYNLNAALPNGVGFYYWTGTKWSKLISRDNISSYAWSLTGNTGTNPATQYIGNTDNTPLLIKISGSMNAKMDPVLNNYFYGRRAGNSITTGQWNFFGGTEAGFQTTTGERNVFLGFFAGHDSDSGSNNIAIGNEALANTTTDQFLKYNIAIGNRAGYNAIGNVTGTTQTELAGIYIGTAAGYNGNAGIAIGDSASYKWSDYRNIAIGVECMKNNTEGALDMAMGYKALMNNTTGTYNVAIGNFSMLANTTGEFNVGLGNNTLYTNITGNSNTAIGAHAGFLIGHDALSNTTTLGSSAKVSSSNTMVFGNDAVDRWAFGITTTTAQHALEVGDDPGNGNGAFLTQGGTWTNTSSISKKEDFTDINSVELLDKIKSLRIQKWKYIGTGEYHIGPVAEEFYELFGLGNDDKGISTVDPAGIALAAIQQLIRENELLKAELQEIRKALRLDRR